MKIQSKEDMLVLIECIEEEYHLEKDLFQLKALERWCYEDKFGKNLNKYWNRTKIADIDKFRFGKGWNTPDILYIKERLRKIK